MKIALLTFFLIYWIGCDAQTRNESKAVLTTQFMVATDFQSVYLNFIGIGVRFGKPNKSISVIVLPALRFYDAPATGNGDPRSPFVTPGFSIGPVIQIRRFLVGFPSFYDGHDAVWRQSVGVGVRIGPP